MRPRLHFTLFLIISLALHALVIAAAPFLIKQTESETPLVLPIKIVNLPQQTLRKLPPLDQPIPRPVSPERIVPPKHLPVPRKFGTASDVQLPKSIPDHGLPDGGERGKDTGKSIVPKAKSPLPFLTQRDIDELARKGMPGKKPGDNSVTLDTDEFKFISYNRWLKIKVESVLRYPELAAISGYQGTLYIKFDIMKDGSLGDVELLKSSGYKILDDEALRAIRSAAPFQPLPEEWNLERYSIRAAVLFYLSGAYIR